MPKNILYIREQSIRKEKREAEKGKDLLHHQLKHLTFREGRP